MAPRMKEDAWAQVQSAHDALEGISTLSLFEEDVHRASDFACEGAGLYLDFSKNRISREGLSALLNLATASGLTVKRDAMFRGERINITEDRAVLHTALRDRSGRVVPAGNEDACELAGRERARILNFAEAVINGDSLGYTGKPLTTVVNIGIGGSDLGPLMVVEALRSYWIDGRRSFFVSNVDGQHLRDTLSQCDPESTLFIVASKTFTTQETMTNAQSALAWFREQGGDSAAISKHFVALSTNPEAVSDFGIVPDSTFGFWDWVGGRYSLWSAIGLSIALQVGPQRFLELLDGAHAMDVHFAEEPPVTNMPMLLALAGIWNRNFEGMGVHAVLPYDQHLHRLPAYLQQADMESNGKSVTLDGRRAAVGTGPIIFGEPGTNGQHAFYQLLHQGTDPLSSDFIVAARLDSELGDHHAKLLANVLAQPRALMCGQSEDVVRADLAADGLTDDAIDLLAPHKVFDGDRPSNVILMDRLTPQTLGALIALYEHKIFCQGVIWDVNSFDQWGVELGKVLAKEILPTLETGHMEESLDIDPSTRRLLEWILARRSSQ
ncbi:MAG: glucose-6-phosphate isomerase [Pseudomonadota bacterium]